jgi:hypothetical protein
MRRLNGGLAAGMRHRHARRTLSAVPAHLFTALPLICRELCVPYRTGHDRAPQKEDNEQQPKMDCKFHKLRLTTPKAPRKVCPRTLDTITQQRFQTKAGWYREHAQIGLPLSPGPALAGGLCARAAPTINAPRSACLIILCRIACIMHLCLHGLFPSNVAKR